MWPDLKIVHGKPRHSQSQGSVERANRDVQDMLITWMQTNNTSKWSEGLIFIQLMKNRAFHAGIKQSPYEAMFGSRIKVGLSDSMFPRDCIDKIATEDLQDLLNTANSCENGNNGKFNTVSSKSGSSRTTSDKIRIMPNKDEKSSFLTDTDSSEYNMIVGSSRTTSDKLRIIPNEDDKSSPHAYTDSSEYNIIMGSSRTTSGVPFQTGYTKLIRLKPLCPDSVSFNIDGRKLLRWKIKANNLYVDGRAKKGLLIYMYLDRILNYYTRKTISIIVQKYVNLPLRPLICQN